MVSIQFYHIIYIFTHILYKLFYFSFVNTFMCMRGGRVDVKGVSLNFRGCPGQVSICMCVCARKNVCQMKICENRMRADQCAQYRRNWVIMEWVISELGKGGRVGSVEYMYKGTGIINCGVNCCELCVVLVMILIYIHIFLLNLQIIYTILSTHRIGISKFRCFSNNLCA